jgi:glutaredoxin
LTTILYSTDCSKCKILKAKLDEKGLSYEVCSNKDLMINKGFLTVPVLQVDDAIMEFFDAIEWLREK